jgi:hypothetical protein
MFPFRLQFTVRSLAIFVTLVCAYLGAWEVTKRYGVAPPFARAGDSGGRISAADEYSPMPFIVREEELANIGCILYRKQTYYLWLCGPKFPIATSRSDL